MATPPVGADIESLCSKCGDVWHVVVAKVGEKIAKVQCKQCSGFHRHRPLPGPNGVATAPTARVPGVKKARATKAPAIGKASVAIDESKPLRRYRPADSYAIGDRLDHPNFGTGVVESSPGPGKMQVFFPGGRRVLVQAREGTAQLERPRTSVAED